MRRIFKLIPKSISNKIPLRLKSFMLKILVWSTAEERCFKFILSCNKEGRIRLQFWNSIEQEYSKYRRIMRGGKYVKCRVCQKIFWYCQG